jgi:hypothetical protein
VPPTSGITSSLPWLSPGSSAAAPLAAFRAFLADRLRTTLVLADGTRVKVVTLHWEPCVAQERHTAVAAIAAAMRDELASHPAAPVRRELDAL